MNWSATEIAALATKAARGAGAPPQQAARFGQAAALHLSAARASDALAEALDRLPGGAILDYPLALDAALSAARSNGAADIAVAAQDALLESYIEVLPFLARAETTQNGTLKLIVDFTKPSLHKPPRRISDCAALITQMSALAARTFVPESEASRSAGAGAGLTDND